MVRSGRNYNDPDQMFVQLCVHDAVVPALPAAMETILAAHWKTRLALR
jgi:hypothetical protein